MRSSTLHVAVIVVLSSSGIKYGRKISVNHPPSVLKIWNLWWEIMWKNIRYRCCAILFLYLHIIYHIECCINHNNNKIHTVKIYRNNDYLLTSASRVFYIRSGIDMILKLKMNISKHVFVYSKSANIHRTNYTIKS